MTLSIYNPQPFCNDYFSKLWVPALRKYAEQIGEPIKMVTDLNSVSGGAAVLLTDHLSQDRILMLKGAGCKIIGFNVTDSSSISGAIRHVPALQLVDLIFSLTGIQKVRTGQEFFVDDDFNVSLREAEFLGDEDWHVFDYMRRSGKLQSLPYVPWTAPPEVPRQPYNQRSQKVLIRGGGHARRFVLALFLLRKGLLDTNSGFVLHPYFDEDMNPQFRYCDDCRKEFRANGRAKYYTNRHSIGCNSPAARDSGDTCDWILSDLGQWNNRCPRSFFWMAERFSQRHGAVDMNEVEKLLNARWLDPKDHQAMLARITFSSDLKWLHSIYAPQRFWEAASAGCINVLPTRTMDQEYFPKMEAGRHYMVFEETFKNLELAFQVDEQQYNEISANARALYDQWIAPGRLGVNERLLAHIFDEVRQVL